jgi:hypothetical protein
MKEGLIIATAQMFWSLTKTAVLKRSFINPIAKRHELPLKYESMGRLAGIAKEG